MGTFHHKHRSVILHNWDNDKQKQIINDFKKTIPDEFSDYIKFTNLMNGFLSIQFLPSGSKAGWHEYDYMNLLWESFKEILDENFDYPSYIDYQFGGDAGITLINDTTDKVVDTSNKLELSKKENFHAMLPIYTLLNNLYKNNPEIFLKYTNEISAIIRETGLKELEINGTLFQDSHWM